MDFDGSLRHLEKTPAKIAPPPPDTVLPTVRDWAVRLSSPNFGVGFTILKEGIDFLLLYNVVCGQDLVAIQTLFDFAFSVGPPLNSDRILSVLTTPETPTVTVNMTFPLASRIKRGADLYVNVTENGGPGFNVVSASGDERS